MRKIFLCDSNGSFRSFDNVPRCSFETKAPTALNIHHIIRHLQENIIRSGRASPLSADGFVQKEFSLASRHVSNFSAVHNNDTTPAKFPEGRG